MDSHNEELSISSRSDVESTNYIKDQATMASVITEKTAKLGILAAIGITNRQLELIKKLNSQNLNNPKIDENIETIEEAFDNIEKILSK